MKEELIEKVGMKAMEMLEALALKLGTNIDHLWEVLIRQCYLDAGYHFGLCLLFITGLSVGITFIYKAYHSEDKYRCGEPDVMISFVVCVVCIVGILVNFGAVMQALNPEYFALRNIVALLK